MQHQCAVSLPDGAAGMQHVYVRETEVELLHDLVGRSSGQVRRTRSR
jgi:hypothetical protein